MEGMLFVDGDYPDFSLLKEVLSPPCWETSPSKDPYVEGQWVQDEAVQYHGQPLCATGGQAAQSNRGCTSPKRPAEGALRASREDTGVQHCGVASRGSAKHRNRSVLENLEPWRPSRGHIHNLRRRNKMRCLIQIPQPDIIYFLQESLKKLPKVEKREFNSVTPRPEDPRHQQSDFPMYESNYTPRLWNYYANSPSVINNKVSLQSCNEMELLNLISLKCTHLEEAGGWQEDGAREGPELKILQGDFRGRDRVLGNASGNQGPDVQFCVNPNKNCIKTNINLQTVCEERGSCNKGAVLEKVQGDGEDKTPNNSWPLKNGELNLPPQGRKIPRKPATPVKSAEKVDPSFRGVEFQMRIEKEHCGNYPLIVTSLYRGVRRKSTKKSKHRNNTNTLSSGSDDDHISSYARRTKQCASCKTQKTPLWRDAEDGTPLCNACGIRYKKYGVRCYDCWNIPKRDGKTCSRYCECGGTFRAQP